MNFGAFTGTPGGMPMAFVRCYTGTDGQSHFEDLDLLPPAMERSIEQAASNITFTRSPIPTPARDGSIAPTVVVRENSHLSQMLNSCFVIRMRAPALIKASARRSR